MTDSVTGLSVADAALPALVVVFIVAVLGWLIAAVVNSVRESRRRREAIFAMVAATGYNYVAEDPSLVGAFEGAPFGTGESRTASDVVTGAHAGGWFQTFAYSYMTWSSYAGSDGAMTVHRFQVTWVPLAAAFPHTRITPDSKWLRELGTLDGHDINVESADFNRRWRVRANDERTAQAILTGPMIERFMRADVTDRAVIFQGTRLMSFAPKASDLTELDAVVGMLQDIAASVPPVPFDDLRARPGL